MGKDRSSSGRAEALRNKAEKLLAENSRQVSRTYCRDDVDGLNHELSVHHIELEMQNDELRRAQEELEESHSRYLDLYERAPVGYLTFDGKGVVLDMNLTATSLLGLERMFLLNKPFTAVIAPESQDAFHLHRRKVLRSSHTQTCELMLRNNKGGERSYARLESIAVRSNGTKVMRSVLTNISERKGVDVEELQRRLEEAEQTIEAIRKGEVDAIVRSDQDGSSVYALEGPDHPYRNIVETLNAGAVTIDQRATIFYSNTAFSHMTGIPLESLIGSSFSDLVVPDDLPLFLDFLEKTRKADKMSGDIRLRGSQGALFVRLAGNSQTIYGIERTSIVISDISALKAAEESSRKEAQSAQGERDRLMTLIDSMNDGVWFANAEGVVMLVNSVAKAQAVEVGIDPDTLLGSPTSALLPAIGLLTSEGEALETGPLMRVFLGEPFHGVEVALRHRTTGEVFYRRISGNPIIGRDKRIEGVITVTTDITAEKRAAAERSHLEEQLRQSQKLEAIGTLAGGIAHDFNNMLAVIMGNAELIVDDISDNHRASRGIEQIVKASKRARDLIKQILLFSRKTEAGRNPLSLIPLIRETHQLLRASLPTTVDIKVEIETESDTVTADPSQIQQVLMNFATNAAHAMRDNGGALTIGLSTVTLKEDGPLPDPEMEAGTYLKLTVRDTGKGMTEKTRKRIFEPFFTTKPPGQGTGMGLAVVYGIVKSHGGAITVESEPGRGSTFTVFLPCTRERATEEARAAGHMPRGKERILLADDEESIREMTSLMLTRLGYEVTTAQNGSEALQTFLDEPSRFDLVITDQTMPDLTGIDLARRMLEARKDLPIILITGYSETVSPERAKRAGIREFVMKPIERREMATTVRRVLDTER